MCLVWNPNSGCERITEGCKFCYAHTIAENKFALSIQSMLIAFHLLRVGVRGALQVWRMQGKMSNDFVFIWVVAATPPF